jgi:hypothetical protein
MAGFLGMALAEFSGAAVADFSGLVFASSVMWVLLAQILISLCGEEGK